MLRVPNQLKSFGPGRKEGQGWRGKKEDHSPGRHVLPGIFVLVSVNHPVALCQTLEDKGGCFLSHNT